jgi:formate dehydrogenase assembly factor FdhD
MNTIINQFTLHSFNTNISPVEPEENPVHRQVARAQRVQSSNRRNQPRRKRTRTIAIQTGCDVNESDIIMSNSQQLEPHSLEPSAFQAQAIESLIQERFPLIKYSR